MRELVGGKNTIGRTAAVLKKPHKATFTFTFIRTLVIHRLCPSGKLVENSTKITCLEITCYRIKYSTVLWLLKLHIWRGRKVETLVRTVNNNSRTSNCQCSLFSEKNPIIRIFCISGRLAVPTNRNKWTSTVLSVPR